MRAVAVETKAPPRPGAIPDVVAQSVEKAERLLAYVAGRGRLPKGVAGDAVAQARAALDRGEWPVDVAASFWPTYGDLAEAAKPVTAESLLEDEKESAAGSLRGWSVGAFVLLPVLILLSGAIYLNEHAAKDLRTWSERSLALEKDLRNVVAAAEPGEEVQARIDDYLFAARRMRDNARLLRAAAPGLADPGELPAPQPAVAPRDVARQAIDAVRGIRLAAEDIHYRNEMVVGTISTYLLPILYALLGSFAFGLRSLSEETAAKTFVPSYGAYARAIIAVIVGFAVGMFSGFGADAAVPPLALAFLAGYAVEAFFSFLDSLLRGVARTPKGA